jgi:LmbE family N-acetylglucosaminyl deacetylase
VTREDTAGRLVVISPHLDDAALSLGAAVASWARLGRAVTVLTVLACDPSSPARAGGWDRRARFATEGEAARARREEDEEACALLGAAPRWLPFGSSDYERHGSDDEIRAAVVSALAGAETVLLPGFPLTHPDHSWLASLLTADRLPCARVGLYAEQPYSARSERSEPRAVSAWLSSRLSPSAFEDVPSSSRDRLAKYRAVRRYRSQLGLLGLSGRMGAPLLGLVWARAEAGKEAVAWVREP